MFHFKARLTLFRFLPHLKKVQVTLIVLFGTSETEQLQPSLTLHTHMVKREAIPLNLSVMGLAAMTPLRTPLFLKTHQD